MERARVRLVVAAVLFLAWLGWLFYLVTVSRNPVILSRPQFLVADVYVVARVSGTPDEPGTTVTIEEVMWSMDQEHAPTRGQDITVKNLDFVAVGNGWAGDGTYILPLMQSLDGSYRLAPIPTSPGYHPNTPQERFRIYPATEDAGRQLKEMVAKK